MPELLTTAIVADELGKLVVAFPGNIAAKKNPAMLADTYRRGLEGIEADAFRAAVNIAIREDNYFPRVARLRELSAEWMRRNRAPQIARIEGAWNVCPVCGAEAVSESVTRPKLYKPESGKWYYLTLKGEKIARGDVLAAQARGVLLEMETVLGERTVINHRPEAHHIRKGEEGEYEGAA